MIKAAKMTNTGLATTGLIGAGVGIGVVFGIRTFSNSLRVLVDNSDEERSRVLEELNDKGNANFHAVLGNWKEVVKWQKTIGLTFNAQQKSLISNEHDKIKLQAKNMWQETSSIINKDNNTGWSHVSVQADKDLIDSESRYLSYQSISLDNVDTIIKNSQSNSTIANSFLERYSKILEQRKLLLEKQRSLRTEQISKLDEIKEYDGDSRPSLIDDFADVSTEGPDYTGGDD